MTWLGQALQFLPLVLAISIVCAAMKEDRVPVIVAKGARFGLTLAVFTILFAVGVKALMVAFL